MEAVITKLQEAPVPVTKKKHSPFARMRPHALRLLMLFIASYGLFCFAYKFERPSPYSNDYYYNYYFMYQSPLNLHAAPAPFVCRQISAVLTHLVLRSHLYLRNPIALPGNFDQHVLFAAMFTNWVFLVLAAWLAGLIAEEELGGSNAAAALIAGFLCLLEFQTQFCVITGLTEGVSWFLLAAGFLAYVRRATLPLLLILVLSIFQRETVIIALGLIAALDLLLTRTEKRFRLQVCVTALLCFLAYLLARRLFISGYEQQTHPAAMLAVLKQLRLTRTLLDQLLFSQNIVAIFLAMLWLGRRKTHLHTVRVSSLLITLIVIDFLGLGAGVGDNVGRIAAVMAPPFAGLAAAGFWRQQYRFQ